MTDGQFQGRACFCLPLGGCVMVIVLECRSRDLGFESRPRQTFVSALLFHLHSNQLDISRDCDLNLMAV